MFKKNKKNLLSFFMVVPFEIKTTKIGRVKENC